MGAVVEGDEVVVAVGVQVAQLDGDPIGGQAAAAFEVGEMVAAESAGTDDVQWCQWRVSSDADFAVIVHGDAAGADGIWHAGDKFARGQGRIDAGARRAPYADCQPAITIHECGWSKVQQCGEKTVCDVDGRGVAALTVEGDNLPDEMGTRTAGRIIPEAEFKIAGVIHRHGIELELSAISEFPAVDRGPVNSMADQPQRRRTQPPIPMSHDVRLRHALPCGTTPPCISVAADGPA